MTQEQFQPDEFYRADDPAMRVIASRGVLAQWRYRSEGPPYFKFGARVAYKGSDLNAWLPSVTSVRRTALARPGGPRCEMNGRSKSVRGRQDVTHTLSNDLRSRDDSRERRAAPRGCSRCTDVELTRPNRHTLDETV